MHEHNWMVTLAVAAGVCSWLELGCSSVATESELGPLDAGSETAVV